MGYYCNICKKTITEREYDYSNNHFKKALCREHKNNLNSNSDSKSESKYALTKSTSKSTPQAQTLYNELLKRGIKCELESFDGYKHVDIAIHWAKLYLELDGKQHGFSAKQMIADDERDKYSQKDGYSTKRIPNEWVNQNVNKLANNIAVLAKKRYREIKENEENVSVKGIFKKLLNKLSEKLEDFE